jgi:hypothetical protein
MGEKCETNHRRHKHSPRKRNVGMPVGDSEQIALRRVQCRVYTCYWVTTLKQTRKQHPLLGNRFLISKYMQLLLSKAVANKDVPTETVGVQHIVALFFHFVSPRISISVLFFLRSFVTCNHLCLFIIQILSPLTL